MQAKTKNFLNPKSAVFQSGLQSGQSVADLGVGSGHYALAAAEIVGQLGTVYAFDVKEQALDHLAAEARLRRLKNIRTRRCDLDEPELEASANVPAGTCDLAIVANILHEVESQKNLLKHAYSMLKSGGRILVIDWNSNPSPIGPPADKRVGEAQARKLLESSSFRFAGNIDADPYHYGLLFEK